FFRLEHPIVRYGAYLALVVWGCLGLCIAAGWGGRWARVANLILSAIFLRNILHKGIYTSTFTLNAWLSVLTPCDFRLRLGQRESPNCPQSILNSALPLFFVGLHFGFIFLDVALDKLLCPLWATGAGFYNFAVMPWVLPPHLDWITDHKLLMVLGNWGGLLVESLFVVLWLFRKSRPVAIAGLMLLGIGLCWPFNIFLIGPLAVTFALGLSSILLLERFRGAVPLDSPVSGAWFLIPAYSILFFVPHIMETDLHPPSLSHRVSYFESAPEWKRGQDVTDIVRRPSSQSVLGELARDLNGLELLQTPWKSIGVWFLAAKRHALFSKRHTLGMYGYRIELETPTAKRIEPVSYFTRECERANSWDGFLESNCYLAANYAIGDFARWASFGRFYGDHLQVMGGILVEPFFENSMAAAGSDRVPIKRVVLLVKAIETSVDWRGRLEQSSDGWTELIIFYPETGRYELGRKPHQHAVQGRDPSLPNYLKYWNEE
ncbi:MAG: hypothetical protein MK102_18390, partial [Fuerstiella sp.]|nr:hypothetical protein [Fuerstiella sp.]